MERNKILVLYGSETGTSQEVAEKIWRDSRRLNFKGAILPMDEYDITRLIYEPLVIFVCSTTGQGDQPSNMRNFWKYLLRKSLPSNSLICVKFGVLGLGDSSYVKFNHAAKKLHRRLISLGGSPLCEIGLADDQHDLGADAVTGPWISNLWKTLDAVYNFPEGSLPVTYTELPPPRWKVTALDGVEGAVFDEPVGNPGERNYKVQVTSNQRTTTPEHFQEVRLIKFRAKGEGTEKSEEDTPHVHLEWKPGDVAYVRPQNRRQAVSHLMSLLPHSPDIVLSISQIDEDCPVPGPLRKAYSLQTLAVNYWDLNAVSQRYTLEILAFVTPNEMEAERLHELAQGGEDWISYAVRPKRTVVELLADFPHAAAHIPLSYLPEIFQPIRPRAFSISSPPVRIVTTAGFCMAVHVIRSSQSPRQFRRIIDEEEIHLLVAVVKYNTKLFIPRYGLCSNWLASLAVGQELQMTLRKGSLTFPEPPMLVPVMMVGPGTGVAPFRSYIGCMPCTRSILFFGCRNREGDFHFKDEWAKAPELTLFTAFSRDQPYKIYVQHLIEREGELVAEMIYKHRCNFYVAGNAKDMPEAVKNAVIGALEKYTDMNRTQAEAYVEQMFLESRYQTETWS